MKPLITSVLVLVPEKGGRQYERTCVHAIAPGSVMNGFAWCALESRSSAPRRVAAQATTAVLISR
ncbi:MAG: hypothetical protein U0636_11570 [Phycisphaerales bacterium]